MKKILFLSRKPLAPIGQGGAETIAYDLLSELHNKEKAHIKTLGSFQFDDVPALSSNLNKLNVELKMVHQENQCRSVSGQEISYPVYTHIFYDLPESYNTCLARNDHYFASVEEFYRQFTPDICLIQAQGALELYQYLRHKPAKLFLYIQSGLELKEFVDQNLEPPTLIVNSKFLQEKVKQEYGLESHLLYPAIDLVRYRVPMRSIKSEDEKFVVLFINPHRFKGLDIFLTLAQNNPHIEFRTVETWFPIDDQLRHQLVSLGNVKVISKTWEMAEVYAGADLLLAPSQWEEAFGRVVVEAHASGLPSLVSKVGGLPEASGDCGFKVFDYQNPDAWQLALSEVYGNRMQLPNLRASLMQNAERFTPDISAECLLNIIQ